MKIQHPDQTVDPDSGVFLETLSNIVKESGHCFTTHISSQLPSDKEGKSQIIVFEDGVMLEKGACIHDEIRNLGLGRYSHWEGSVLFCSSDNSNVLTNGRKYSIRLLK